MSLPARPWTGWRRPRPQRWGGVDILVLNHGGPPQCTASEMTEAQLVEWFQHIVVSPIRIANKLLPAMRARGRGRIIVVGSTGMQQPIPNLALSNTLRASIWAWLKTMSGEVAKDGVTMNVLAPGTIHTDRTNESAAAIGAGFVANSDLDSRDLARN
jgi:3-oxoacyl-[acyl-carrier protein] reductase